MNKKWVWLLWIVLTISVAGFYLYKILLDEDKQVLVVGDVTHGHFQIEMACASCHTDAFQGQEALQKACLGCHAQELEDAHDSHPKKKFTDPRNADLLKVIDARYCISCHTEHQKEQTRSMGVTLPEDYCFHCHQETIEERESHRNLEFNSCATGGCHNFHDNRALYEKFLIENSGGHWLKEVAHVTENSDGLAAALKQSVEVLAKVATPASNADTPFIEQRRNHPDIEQEWMVTSHAKANIGCIGCHSDGATRWVAKPGVEQCAACHQVESETFLAGKHGMRLAAELDPLDPIQSRMTFADAAVAHNGCNQCHKPHNFDAFSARTEVCLDCHSDQHSLAFMDSPHGRLFKRAQLGEIRLDHGVSCATCHLPRALHEPSGTIIVNHNQNDNLRPNEKMIRPVCMQCHSLEFSIDALADPVLIENNFSGKPSKHIPSIDWALEREEK